MATEIIRPSGAGTYTELNANPPGSNHTRVDEESKDESDYLWTPGGSSYVYRKDTYAMGNPSAIGAGDTINSITIKAYCKEIQFSGSGNGRVKLMYRSGGADYVGAAQNMTTSYVIYEQTWTDNNGSAWTLDDLNAIECGLQLAAYDAAWGIYVYAYCCQFWVEIDYTEATGCPKQMMYRMRMMS